MAEWIWKPGDWRNWEWHGQYAYRTFKKYIPPGSSVLEVGFGSGRMISRLPLDLGCRAFGADVAASAFDSLRQSCRILGSRVLAVRGSILCLPFSSGSFDVVYSEGLIEHFSHEGMVRAMSEHVRVCRRGGYVLVSVPNRYAYFHTIARRVAGARYPYSPERSLSRRELARLAAACGLRLVGVDGFAFGNQFVNFKIYVLNRYLHWRLAGLPWYGLGMLRRLKLYHWDGPRAGSLLGFQTMAVGRKEC